MRASNIEQPSIFDQPEPVPAKKKPSKVEPGVEEAVAAAQSKRSKAAAETLRPKMADTDGVGYVSPGDKGWVFAIEGSLNGILTCKGGFRSKPEATAACQEEAERLNVRLSKVSGLLWRSQRVLEPPREVFKTNTPRCPEDGLCPTCAREQGITDDYAAFIASQAGLDEPTEAQAFEEGGAYWESAPEPPVEIAVPVYASDYTQDEYSGLD